MPIQKLCTVAEAVRLNEFACSLTLEAEGMEPQGPDQFVHVKCRPQPPAPPPHLHLRLGEEPVAHRL